MVAAWVRRIRMEWLWDEREARRGDLLELPVSHLRSGRRARGKQRWPDGADEDKMAANCDWSRLCHTVTNPRSDVGTVRGPSHSC